MCTQKKPKSPQHPCSKILSKSGPTVQSQQFKSRQQVKSYTSVNQVKKVQPRLKSSQKVVVKASPKKKQPSPVKEKKYAEEQLDNDSLRDIGAPAAFEMNQCEQI